MSFCRSIDSMPISLSTFTVTFPLLLSLFIVSKLNMLFLRCGVFSRISSPSVGFIFLHLNHLISFNRRHSFFFPQKYKTPNYIHLIYQVLLIFIVLLYNIFMSTSRIYNPMDNDSICVNMSNPMINTSIST